jgi:hypothetical protein
MGFENPIRGTKDLVFHEQRCPHSENEILRSHRSLRMTHWFEG